MKLLLRCQVVARVLLATMGIDQVCGLAFPLLEFSQSHKDKNIVCSFCQMVLFFLPLNNN